MNTRRRELKVIAGVIAAVGLVSLLCAGQPAGAQRRETVHLTRMVFARGYANGEAKDGGATIFEPKDHVIYCVVGVQNPLAEAKYRFVWYYRPYLGRDSTQIFEQALDDQTSNDVVSKFTSPRDLPRGAYRVELYIDDKLRQTRFFNVGE